MKLSDGIIDCPLSGICQINLDKIIKCFGKETTIVRWHQEYRLINKFAKVKIKISIVNAKTLIEKLNLIEVKSAIFGNASTFMLKKRFLK